MRYLLFDASRVDYDQGSMDKHLKYLRVWNGTPDFWDSAETIVEALDSAKEAPFPLVAIVYEANYQTLEVVKKDLL